MLSYSFRQKLQEINPGDRWLVYTLVDPGVVVEGAAHRQSPTIGIHHRQLANF